MKKQLQRLSSDTVAVLLLLLSIVLATLEAVVVRLMADRISVGQLMLIRSLAQIVLALGISRVLQGRISINWPTLMRSAIDRKSVV